MEKTVDADFADYTDEKEEYGERKRIWPQMDTDYTDKKNQKTIEKYRLER